MKHSKHSKQRYQLILMATGMAVLGALLLFLSVRIKPDYTPAREARTPATAPATSPADSPTERQKSVAAMNMSGMLMLFGLVAVGVSITCIGLLIVEIRRSRPAWMTQQRFPRRR